MARAGPVLKANVKETRAEGLHGGFHSGCSRTPKSEQEPAVASPGLRAKVDAGDPAWGLTLDSREQRKHWVPPENFIGSRRLSRGLVEAQVEPAAEGSLCTDG